MCVGVQCDVCCVLRSRFCAHGCCVLARMRWIVRGDVLCVRVWVCQSCGWDARSPGRTPSFPRVCLRVV